MNVLGIALTKKCNLYSDSRKKKDNEFSKKLFDRITDDQIHNMFLAMTKLEDNILEFN